MLLTTGVCLYYTLAEVGARLRLAHWGCLTRRPSGSGPDELAAAADGASSLALPAHPIPIPVYVTVPASYWPSFPCFQAGIVPEVIPEIQKSAAAPFGLTSFALSTLLVLR
jgi:hypothetical protein